MQKFTIEVFHTQETPWKNIGIFGWGLEEIEKCATPISQHIQWSPNCGS